MRLRGACLALCTILFFSSCAALFTEPPPEEVAADEALLAPKKKILILGFANKSVYSAHQLPLQAFLDIEKVLRDINDVIIVTPADIEGYRDLAKDEVSYDMKAVFEKARGYGISGIVTGSIEEVGIDASGGETGIFRTKEYRMTARVHFQLYDVSTERQILSKFTDGEVIEEHTSFLAHRELASEDGARAVAAVSKALEPTLEVFPTQVKRLGWLGRIAKIDRHRYYINAGAETGIGKGQLLKVFGENFKVEDPKSKVFIGIAPGRFKGILKVIDHIGRDGAIAVLHSGAEVRESDRVEIFSPQ